MGTQTGLAGNKTAEDVAVYGIGGSDGTQATFLPPGRAAQTASVPVVVSNEDKLALDRAAGVYQNGVAYAGATTKGDGVAFSITGAGTVIFAMAGGGTVTLAFPIGSYVVNFACTNVTAGTATGLVANKMTL